MRSRTLQRRESNDDGLHRSKNHFGVTQAGGYERSGDLGGSSAVSGTGSDVHVSADAVQSHPVRHAAARAGAEANRDRALEGPIPVSLAAGSVRSKGRRGRSPDRCRARPARELSCDQECRRG
jgi:hypothetical protein